MPLIYKYLAALVGAPVKSARTRVEYRPRNSMIFVIAFPAGTMEAF